MTIKSSISCSSLKSEEYISKEQEFDINNIQNAFVIKPLNTFTLTINSSNKRKIDELINKDQCNNGKRFKIDDNMDPKFKD
ncbi:12702_t:CDS:2 [Funneliformis mosseae]|uniref:12702_t:CDS:1 n=1 Tax=Funneliformis mosseae TaxID=27381 RepID=A0A9N9FJ66_FUNMO|nr:12702_t:CDS:2 [Funneliformis mosseae]